MTVTRDTAAPAAPYWLTEPCPAWCTRGHEGRDIRMERMHAGEDYDIDLTLEPRIALDGETFPAHLSAGIWQAWRDARPHICLILNDSHEIQLEPSEAGEAAGLLTAPRHEWTAVTLTMMEPDPVLPSGPGHRRWVSAFPFTRPPVLAVLRVPDAVLLFSSFLHLAEQAPGYLTLTPGEAAELGAAVVKLLDGAR